MFAMNATKTGRPSNRQPLKLDCFAGTEAREVLDKLQAQQDLGTGLGMPVANPVWPSQAADYVARASVRETGRTVGTITASRHLTSAEPVLLLQDIALHPAYHPSSLMRRLVAMILLRVTGSEGMPAAVATRAAGGEAVEDFLSLTRHFTGSVGYPSAAGQPVNLSTARLAKRIASVAASSIRYDLATSALRGARLAGNHRNNMPEFDGASTAVDLRANRPVTVYDEVLLLIDLRSEEETVLIDDARRAYRKP